MGKEKIRVLHIDTEKSWRGGQQQVAYLLWEMRSRGFDTALVCQPDSDIEKFCRQHNLPVFPVRMMGELDLISGIKISGICRNRGFNILHSHSAHALSIGLISKVFYRNTKLIATRRVDFHIKNSPLSFIKYSNNLVDRIICISDRIRKVLIEDGIQADKTEVIYSGIDLHRFDHIINGSDIRRVYSIPGHHIIVGTVAAMDLDKDKDYQTLLKGAKIVLGKSDNVTFLAVGDGKDRDAILSFAKRLGINDRFIFAGFQKEVGKFLKSFNIFVLSSKFEGLGTSLLDAQAVGLPVVASRAGGIPEAVENGLNGLLVEPENPEALSEALLKLILDKSLRDKLGQNAKNYVTKFDINRCVEDNIRLYERLIL